MFTLERFSPEGGKLRLAEVLFDQHARSISCEACGSTKGLNGFTKDQGGGGGKDYRTRRLWHCQRSRSSLRNKSIPICPKLTNSSYILRACDVLGQREIDACIDDIQANPENEDWPYLDCLVALKGDTKAIVQNQASERGGSSVKGGLGRLKRSNSSELGGENQKVLRRSSLLLSPVKTRRHRSKLSDSKSSSLPPSAQHSPTIERNPIPISSSFPNSSLLDSQPKQDRKSSSPIAELPDTDGTQWTFDKPVEKLEEPGLYSDSLGLDFEIELPERQTTYSAADRSLETASVIPDSFAPSSISAISVVEQPIFQSSGISDIPPCTPATQEKLLGDLRRFTLDTLCQRFHDATDTEERKKIRNQAKSFSLKRQFQRAIATSKKSKLQEED